MKVDSLLNVPNKLTTNHEKLSHKIEIGDPDIILSYMRKESYKYHLRTAIQEYLSNALDAHREVKQTKRCQIYAPTNDKPTLIIKDFGPGISPERMEKIFCKVGTSSKRASQNEKGGFGAGSKIGLAYCDTVIIITCVNGLKYLYNLTVSRDIGGEVILMAEPTPTKEPNGTEIHLPILHHDIPKSYKAIQRFCFFAEAHETPETFNLPKEYTQTVHDCEKEFIGEKNDKLGNTYLTLSGSLPINNVLETNADCIVVLDGIPYPIDNELKAPLNICVSKVKSRNLVIHFKNGVLDTQLSREGLQNNEKNKKALSTISKLIEKNIEKEIVEMLGDDTSLNEKIKAFHIIDEKYNTAKVTYKNFTIFSSSKTINGVRITHPILDDKNILLDSRIRNSRGSYKSVGERQRSGLSSIPASNKCVFIVDPTKESKVKTGMKLSYLGNKFRHHVNQELKDYSIDTNIFTLAINEKTDPELLEDFISELELTNVFDVEVPKEEIDRHQNSILQNKKTKDEVVLHVISGSKKTEMSKYASKFLVEDFLEEPSSKYIYITLEKYSELKNKSFTDTVDALLQEIKFFKKNEEYTFVATGRADLNKIKKHQLKNFFTLDEVKANYKKNESDFNSYLMNQISSTSLLRYLESLRAKGQIKNKAINKALDIYAKASATNSFRVDFPEFILKLYKDDSTMIKNLDIIDKFDTLISKDKLFSNGYGSMKEESQKEEMLAYVNWKF